MRLAWSNKVKLGQFYFMGGLYGTDNGMLLHLEVDNIKKVIIRRVKSGGRNYRGVYDLIHGNSLPITEAMFKEIMAQITSGQKICDVWNDFIIDDLPNFVDRI